MFTYLSLLVEMKRFREIYVNFLIVGHTHNGNDQYHSTLSNAIKNASFIGSPLALAQLCRQAHSEEGKRPFLVQQIVVYRDYCSAFKPYINSTIKV